MSQEEQLNEKYSIHRLVQEAIRTAHSEPSPQTLLMFENLEHKLIDMNEKLDRHMDQVKEWQDRAEPIIQLGNDTRGASKAVLYITGFIMAVGGAVLMIRQFFK